MTRGGKWAAQAGEAFFASRRERSGWIPCREGTGRDFLSDVLGENGRHKGRRRVFLRRGTSGRGGFPAGGRGAGIFWNLHKADENPAILS